MSFLPAAMAEREEAEAVNLEEQRAKRNRAHRSLKRIVGVFEEKMDAGSYEKLSLHSLQEKGSEAGLIIKCTNKCLDLIDQHEDDEDTIQADEESRREFTRLADTCHILCNDLVALKTVSRLNIDLEKDVCRLEGLKAADPTLPVSDQQIKAWNKFDSC